MKPLHIGPSIALKLRPADFVLYRVLKQRLYITCVCLELQSICYPNFRNTIATSKATQTTNARSIHGDGRWDSTNARVGTVLEWVCSVIVTFSNEGWAVKVGEGGRGVSIHQTLECRIILEADVFWGVDFWSFWYPNDNTTGGCVEFEVAALGFVSGNNSIFFALHTGQI